MLLYSFLYIYLLSLHTLLHFWHLLFSTCISVYFHICIFISSYYHNCIFSYFHAFLVFCIIYIFNLIFLWFVWVIMCPCTCEWMYVCNYLLIYVFYVSVLVCCPTYCGGCLMTGRGCLLNGRYLIPWARVYRIDVLWNIF